MEKNEEKKEKKGISVSTLVIVVVLLIAVIAPISFMAGRSLASKEEKKEDNNVVDDEQNDGEEEIVLEQLTVDSDVVKKLFEVFREDTINCMGDLRAEVNTSMDARKYIAYMQLNDTDFVEKTCGSLNDSYVDGNYCAENDDVWQYYGVNEQKFEETIKNETTKTVSASLLEEKYREIFGQNADFENGSFKRGLGPIAYYDDVNNLYADFSCQCGGQCGGSTHSLNSIEQVDTTLKLNTTITDYNNETKEVVYTFEYEEATGNYIFVNRAEK